MTLVVDFNVKLPNSIHSLVIFYFDSLSLLSL